MHNMLNLHEHHRLKTRNVSYCTVFASTSTLLRNTTCRYSSALKSQHFWRWYWSLITLISSQWYQWSALTDTTLNTSFWSSCNVWQCPSTIQLIKFDTYQRPSIADSAQRKYQSRTPYSRYGVEKKASQIVSDCTWILLDALLNATISIWKYTTCTLTYCK